MNTLYTAWQQAIPSSYNPLVAFGLTNLIGAGAIVLLGVWMIEPVLLLEWIVVPATLIGANAVEYYLHRGPLHRLHHTGRWLLGLDRLAFRQHSGHHHRRFSHEHMSLNTRREVYLVVFPWWGIGVLFGLTMPVFFLVWMAWSKTAAGMMLITAIVYFLGYEWLHLAYHWPTTGWMYRIPVLRRMLLRLRAHHQRHHDPRLMDRWNFNITVPLWDYLMRTVYREHGVWIKNPPVPPLTKTKTGVYL